MNSILNGIYIKDNDIWGFPQIYKTIEFFPLKLKDVEYGILFNKIFHYPKNSIPDKQVLKMSYLKYVLHLVQQTINPNGTEIYDGLLNFLKYVTRNNDIKIEHTVSNDPNIDIFDKIKINIKIGGIDFTEYDFDIIRAIVLEQNGLGIDFIEQYNPELEEYLLAMNQSYSDLTLEDEIFIFCSLMKKTLKEVEDYTLYQFRRHFERILSLSNYELYSPLEVLGQISSKNGGRLIKDYLYHTEETINRYGSILIDKDKYIKSNPHLFDPNFINSK